MGDVGRPMEWFIWGNGEGRSKAHPSLVCKEKETGVQGSIPRLRGDTIKPFASGASDETISLEDQFAGLTDEQDADNEELSDVEWEGWMQDLDRQARLEPATFGEIASPSPLSSPPWPEVFHQHYPSALKFCRPTASASPNSSIFLESGLSPAPIPTARGPGCMTTTITSTVSVGTEAAICRQRSSTITAVGVGSRLKLKKEKAGVKEKNIQPDSSEKNGNRDASVDIITD